MDITNISSIIQNNIFSGFSVLSSYKSNAHNVFLSNLTKSFKKPVPVLIVIFVALAVFLLYPRSLEMSMCKLPPGTRRAI